MSSTASTKTPKRPKKLEPEDLDGPEEKKLGQYREKLTAITKGVFFYDGQTKNVTDKKFGFAKQLATLYNQIKKSHPHHWGSAFYDELRLRLNFMIGHRDHDDARRRVMSFFVVFAFRLLSSGDDALASFLVTYCEQTHCCAELTARQNSTVLIGMMLGYWRSVLFQDLSEEKEEERKLFAGIRDRLYTMAQNRLKDKEETVRAEVYKAMAPLQHVDIHNDFAMAVRKSPKDFIVAGLCDVVSENRFVALQCLDMTIDDPVYVENVTDMATYDKSTKVRREAMTRLSKVNPRKIEPDQLTCLLHNNLSSADESLRKFTKDQLISVWLVTIARKAAARSAADDNVKDQKGLGSALMMLMARSDWDTHHEEMIKVCLAGMEVIQRMLSAESSIGVTEMITFLAEDQTQPRILTRINMNDLLDRKQTASNVALKAFLWRCFVQYCHQKTDRKHSEKGQIDEAERDTSLTRLAPTLHDMCLLVERVIAFESDCPLDVCDDDAEAKNKNFKESALLDCLEICTFLEREATGMEKWKNLLEKLLLDSSMSKKITDHLGDVLVNVHYPKYAITALINVVNSFGDAAHKEFDPNATDLNLTVALHVGHADRATSPAPTESPELLSHKIRVVMSILRTGRITEMHPYLQNIYHDLVPKCFRLGIQERKLAVHVSGFVASLDATMASAIAFLIWKAFSLDDVVESRVSSMDAVCDLLIEYGREQMEEWAGLEDAEFFKAFENILLDQDANEQLYMKAFECCAKIMLNHKREAATYIWADLVSAMLARIFHPSTGNAECFRSCATQFLFLFSSASRANQQLLCSGMCLLLTNIVSNIKDPFLAEILVERACASVAELTHSSRLVADNGDVQDSNEKASPVHRDFAEGLISNLTEVIDYKNILKAHCFALYAIDFEGCGSEFIASCIKGVELAISSDETPGIGENPELAKLHKRLVAVKKAAEKEEDLMKNGDPKTTVRRPRQRPAKAFKCDETMLFTPRAGTPTPTMEATRTRLPRTAKQKKLVYDE